MKKITPLLLLIFLSNILLGQTYTEFFSIEDGAFDVYFQKELPVRQLKIQLTNFSIEDVDSLIVDYSIPNPNASEPINKTAKFSSDGILTLTIDSRFPYQNIYLSISEKFNSNICIQNGLLLTIDLSASLKENKNRRGYVFSGRDAEMNNYLLKYSLQQRFKGKAILIDFWATWCRPCLSAMNDAVALQKSSNDLPVEFIYICTSSDSSLEAWKSKIRAYEIPGVHVYLDESIHSELMSIFSVSALPSYVLISRSGDYKAGALDLFHRIDKNQLSELLTD